MNGSSDEKSKDESRHGQRYLTDGFFSVERTNLIQGRSSCIEIIASVWQMNRFLFSFSAPTCKHAILIQLNADNNYQSFVSIKVLCE